MKYLFDDPKDHLNSVVWWTGASFLKFQEKSMEMDFQSDLIVLFQQKKIQSTITGIRFWTFLDHNSWAWLWSRIFLQKEPTIEQRKEFFVIPS